MMGSSALDSTAAMVPGLTSSLVVPGAGHFVQMEAAERVNEAMLAFLDGLD